MELNLEQALEGPVDLSHFFEVDPARLNRPEVLSLSPVAFQGTLQKVEPGFSLMGRLQIAGTLACSRCLSPVPFQARPEASWVFAPAARKERSEPPGHGKTTRGKRGKPTDEEIELCADDLDVVTYEKPAFPLDPLIEEELQLEIPLKILCRDDCRGLCPTCGADRNTTSCDCAPEKDARWGALRLAKEPS